MLGFLCCARSSRHALTLRRRKEALPKGRFNLLGLLRFANLEERGQGIIKGLVSSLSDRRSSARWSVYHVGFAVFFWKPRKGRLKARSDARHRCSLEASLLRSQKEGTLPGARFRVLGLLVRRPGSRSSRHALLDPQMLNEKG